MTPEQFVYWLQGFNEMAPDVRPTPEQWTMIQAHLATVFTKVTPPLHIPEQMPISPGIPTPSQPTEPWAPPVTETWRKHQIDNQGAPLDDLLHRPLDIFC